MHRIAHRIPRLLAATAVPVILATAGCSLPGGGPDADSSSDKPSKSAEPTVKAAKYAKLPDACKAVPQAMVKKLVPKLKDPGGKELKSDDTSVKRGCAWSALSGYQFRWLDVSYKRYDSETGLGTGEKRAAQYYKQQSALARATEGAKGMKDSSPKLGDEAIALSYTAAEEKQDFAKATVITRTANVVLTVTYNGTGYEGAKQPQAADLLKAAQTVAETSISAVR